MPKLSQRQQRILALAYQNRGKRSAVADITSYDILAEFHGYERRGTESGSVRRKPEAPERYEADLAAATQEIANLVKLGQLTYGTGKNTAAACLTGDGIAAVDRLLAAG